MTLLLRLVFEALRSRKQRPVSCEGSRARAARAAGAPGRCRYLHLGLLDGLLPYLLVVGPDLEGEEAEGTAGPAPARAAPHSPSSGTRKWHPCRERPWGAAGRRRARGGPAPVPAPAAVTLETAASPVLDCLRLRLPPPRPRPGSTRRAPSPAPPRPPTAAAPEQK